MLSSKYYEAKDLIRNKKIRVTHSGNGLVTYLVGRHHVFYDRRKQLYSCECIAEAWKIECKHVMAVKMLIEGDPKEKIKWKI